MNEMTDRWLSISEILPIFRRIQRHNLQMDREKGLPAHKIGRLWMFKKEEVDEWVRSGQAAE